MSTAKTAPAVSTMPNDYDPASYPTHPQPQQIYNPGALEADTLSNSHSHSQGDYGTQQAVTRPARFNEEWDASQRGSSIADGAGPSTHPRPTSYSGHTGGVTGEGATSLSRGNTLRKKASLRRSGSLKRSGSRRSMNAGSVRSLALQPTTDQDEMQSAFYCPVPTGVNPTEALANRFQGLSFFLLMVIHISRN